MIPDLEPAHPAPSIPEQYGRLVSYSLPCTGVSLAGFLRAAVGQPRFYWESRRDRIAFAGLGSALELAAWGPGRFRHIQEQAAELFAGAAILNPRQPLAVPRLFGGFAFRDDFVPDNTWADFPPAHFVLPHYQLLSIGGQKWLSINVQVAPEEDPAALRDDLHEALTARIAALLAAEGAEIATAAPNLLDVSYPLSYDTWADRINAARERIRAGELVKVVLARVSEARFADRVAVDRALRYLADHYADCYRFLYEPRPYHAFCGATPELLAAVDGPMVRTMALAGSIRRGDTPEQDRALAAQLLADPKERHEHEIVVQRLRERLVPLAESLHHAETDTLLLSNIQHLYTPFEGHLREQNGVLPVVAALHPTPALGGDPRDVAMQVIRQSEPVPRGWYAAPIGWIDHRLNGQFAVAIRSAVTQEKRAWLYAGAGIVADSQPDKEWAETALKFRPMLNALGAGGWADG